jgi:hypothetical protein
LVNSLLNRIDQLEQKAKKVDELEAEVNSLKAGQAAAAADSQPVTIKETWPQLDFSGQGDVDYTVSSDKHSKNTFFLGDLTPLLVARLSDQAQITGDFAITSDNQSGDGFNFDIERLFAEYDINDYFHIEGGRVNTSIGYYNNVYHNGTYFQTTVDRPGIYDFEDNGGILPDHFDGLTVTGEIPSGSLNLNYVAQIGNGRDYNLNQPAFFVSDNNDFKAVNFELSAKPDWAEGNQFGASVYHDTVTTPGIPRVDQLILNAYEVYKTPSFEILAEGILMRDAPVNQQGYWTAGGYVQVDKKFGKFRPYFRWEWRNTPDGDPLMSYIGQNVSIWGPTCGIRYDFTPMMALKLENEIIEQRGIDAQDQVTIQWTFRY